MAVRRRILRMGLAALLAVDVVIHHGLWWHALASLDVMGAVASLGLLALLLAAIAALLQASRTAPWIALGALVVATFVHGISMVPLWSGLFVAEYRAHAVIVANAALAVIAWHAGRRR